MATKEKSQQQVRFLLSKGSPLNPKQKAKLMRELRSKQVRVTKNEK